MASFTLLRSGAWRVQVRRKGAYVAETFLRKTEAQDWAREAEIAIDRGLKPPRRGQTAPKKGQTTLGHRLFEAGWRDGLKAMELHLDIRKALMQQRTQDLARDLTKAMRTPPGLDR